MIPSDPTTLKKMQELADRNIANGDWGDEVTIQGLPGETMPLSPEERNAKDTVSQILAKARGQRIPKQTKGNT
jgi:hypothetical protein